MRLQFGAYLMNEYDELFECDCVCDVMTEHDPLGTGDSPTETEVTIIDVTYDGESISLTDNQELRVANTALEILRGA
jgi:hypothetical protein